MTYCEIHVDQNDYSMIMQFVMLPSVLTCVHYDVFTNCYLACVHYDVFTNSYLACVHYDVSTICYLACVPYDVFPVRRE